MLPILDRSQCATGPRPCRRASCRYHLDPVEETPDYLLPSPSCALDVADAVAAGAAPPPSQEQVARWMGLCHQGVSAVEARALAAVGAGMRDLAAEHGYDGPPVTPTGRREAERRAREAAILAQLTDDPVSAREIARATGIPRRYVFDAVERLRARGHEIFSDGDGFRLVSGRPRLRRSAGTPRGRLLAAVLGALGPAPASAAALGLRLCLTPDEVHRCVLSLRARGHAVQGDREDGYYVRGVAALARDVPTPFRRRLRAWPGLPYGAVTARAKAPPAPTVPHEARLHALAARVRRFQLEKYGEAALPGAFGGNGGREGLDRNNPRDLERAISVAYDCSDRDLPGVRHG